MTLLLTTPEQHSFDDPTLELDDRRLKQWLASLPVLNTGESLRKVLAALEPLNEQRLDSERRLRLLKLYRASIKDLYDAAEPVRLRQQSLSRRQRQEAVDNVERLCLAVANGFKIVIKEMHAAGVRDTARFGQVLRWAVQQLSAALLHSFRFYRPEPPFVFLELNQLYCLARHHGLHETTGARNGDAAGHSLAAIYQAACLLSVADPFSLEEGQAEAYFQALLQVADGVRIIPGNSWQGVPEGLFFIDLQSDSRPRHCVLLESPVSGDEPHILDARKALQRMHRTLAALPANRRSQRPETSLLKALLPEVPSRDKRRSERHDDGRWVELVVGLDAISEWIQARQRGAQPETARWQVKDASAEGYALVWDESAASLLQVGDLLCLVADSEQEQPAFQLLVVRRVQDGREQGTELGVEKLVGMPNPVRVVLDAEPDDSYQALFLPSSGAAGSVARLVAPTPVYQENRALLIYVGEREVPVRCGVRVEQAPGFDCFEFTSDSR
ncbi:MAG TPA: hypothetical protein ENJ80_02430 [Gammaproteobacteria bacterium]|nr:hypothetical protein [Gammaproteobacteria bacterium]